MSIKKVNKTYSVISHPSGGDTKTASGKKKILAVHPSIVSNKQEHLCATKRQ